MNNRVNLLDYFPPDIVAKFKEKASKKGSKAGGLSYITNIDTMWKYINALEDEEDKIKAKNIFNNRLNNFDKSKEVKEKTEEAKKQVYQDIQIPQSKNIIPNFKYSSIKDFNFLGNIKIDNIKNEETYIELSVNISFNLYELYYSLVLLVTSFHLVQEDGTIVHTFEDTPVIKDDIIKGNLINTFHNRFANIIKGYSLVDKINYYEIEDNSGRRLYFVDDYKDINKYMFLFGSSSIGPASIHPYKSLMIYFVNHVKRINIGAVMLTPNRQSYIIHCLAIPIDKNDLCSSARIEFYSYPEKYELYLNLSDVLIKS